VLACFDDYYNFNYRDPAAHLCVRLHDPATRAFLGYGYVAMDKDDAGAIASCLDGGSEDDLRPLMIEFRSGSKTPQTHQVEIVRMVEAGWRSDRAVADTGGGKSTEMRN